MTALDRIIDAAREDVARRRRAVPLAELELGLEARGPERPFHEALTHPGISVIAEFKRRSPSAGSIRDGSTVDEIVSAYEAAGAAALSVLTEEHNFGGSLGDLRDARAASTLPILRKDFIIDPYQVVESVVAGADAILLIVAILTDAQLAKFHALATEAGLAVLVEVHDEEELNRALKLAPQLVGVNNRNLKTFAVDLATTEQLAAKLFAATATASQPPLLVAESGIHTRADVERVQRFGAGAILVGESLVKQGDIGAKVRELIR